MTEVAGGAGAANDATVAVTDGPPTPQLQQLQAAHTEAITAAEGAKRKVGKQRGFLADAEATADAALRLVDETAAAVEAEIERVRHGAAQARARLDGAEGGA